jgi:hypothetical protein
MGTSYGNHIWWSSHPPFVTLFRFFRPTRRDVKVRKMTWISIHQSFFFVSKQFINRVDADVSTTFYEWRNVNSKKNYLFHAATFWQNININIALVPMSSVIMNKCSHVAAGIQTCNLVLYLKQSSYTRVLTK